MWAPALRALFPAPAAVPVQVCGAQLPRGCVAGLGLAAPRRRRGRVVLAARPQCGRRGRLGSGQLPPQPHSSGQKPGLPQQSRQPPLSTHLGSRCARAQRPPASPPAGGCAPRPAGCFLGRGGANVNRVKDETGVYIQFTKPGTAVNTERDRMLILAADDVETARHAFSLLMDLVASVVSILPFIYSVNSACIRSDIGRMLILAADGVETVETARHTLDGPGGLGGGSLLVLSTCFFYSLFPPSSFSSVCPSFPPCLPGQQRHAGPTRGAGCTAAQRAVGVARCGGLWAGLGKLWGLERRNVRRLPAGQDAPGTAAGSSAGTPGGAGPVAHHAVDQPLSLTLSGTRPDAMSRRAARAVSRRTAPWGGCAPRRLESGLYF